MGRQRIIWVAIGLAALAVAVVGLWLTLWPSSGQIQSSRPGDGATIQEAMQVQVTRSTPETGQATRPGGEQTTISDSVEFILRDASGKVKQVVRGP